MTDHEDDKLDEVISAFRRIPVPPRSLRPAFPTDPHRRGGRPISVRRASPRKELPHAPQRTLSVRHRAPPGGPRLARPEPLEPIALAEVIQATERHKLVRYQLRTSPMRRPSVPSS